MLRRFLVGLTTIFALLAPTIAAAEVPSELPVQAFLTDDDGVPIDGTVTVGFAVYNAEADGDMLHFEEQTLEADAGAFTAYLTPDMDLFSDYSTLFLGLSVDGGDEMSPRIKLATVPFAAVANHAETAGSAEQADNALTLDGLAADDFASADHQHDWDDLQNVPEEVCRTYSATFPLEVDANDEVRLSDSCPDGNVLKWDAASSSWSCAEDEDETNSYTAGAGIEVDSNNAISLNTACSAGQVLKWTGSDWGCEDDDNATYRAGAGLELTDDQFGVDSSVVQQRVDGACPDGEFVMGINQDGTVVCGTDQNDDTTYDAGDGVALQGTTFSADTNTMQARVDEACADGEYIMGINQDGTVVCGTDEDTDTTYDAGSGLALNGTTFAVDADSVQSRVNGSCGSGQYIVGINRDGTVICDSDDDTEYTAGTGLARDDNEFSVAEGGITSAEIADSTITSGDIADSAVTSSDIEDSTITSGDIADSAVTSEELANATIVDEDISPNAAIHPSKVDGGAATLDGNNTYTGDNTFNGDVTANNGVTADSVTADSFNYPSPQTRKYQMPASIFQPASDLDIGDWNINSFGGYGYGSENTTSLMGPVQLPVGATMTKLECYIRDGSSANDMSVYAELRRAEITVGSSGGYDELADSGYYDTSGSPSEVEAVTVTDIDSPTIDGNYLYTVKFYYNPDSNTSLLRFYGCAIEYEVDGPTR